jgi:hypothetical protein
MPAKKRFLVTIGHPLRFRQLNRKASQSGRQGQIEPAGFRFFQTLETIGAGKFQSLETSAFRRFRDRQNSGSSGLSFMLKNGIVKRRMNGELIKVTAAGAAVFLTVCLVSPCRAMVRVDGGTGDPGAFPASVAVSTPGGLCSGTVVGDGWYVLTAKHCTTGPEGQNAGAYSFQNALGQSAAGNAALGVLQGANNELVLIPLETRFGAFVNLYAGAYNVGDIITFVGQGQSATVPGSGVVDLPAGTLRQGQGVISYIDSANGYFAYASGQSGLNGASAQILPGDSGSGVFVTIGGTNYLVGVNVALSGPLNGAGGVSYAVPVSADHTVIMSNWILADGPATVPEPGTLGLLVVGIGALFFIRRQLRSDHNSAYALTSAR